MACANGHADVVRLLISSGAVRAAFQKFHATGTTANCSMPCLLYVPMSGELHGIAPGKCGVTSNLRQKCIH